MSSDTSALPFAGMGSTGELASWLKTQALSGSNRPIRLRLAGDQGALDGALMIQRFDITEEVCADNSLCMRLLCIATRADLPAQLFLGLPIEVQLVTDRGSLRSFCGVVVEAVPGQCDGGVQTWMLKAVDVPSFMAGGRNSRVFLRSTVQEITHVVLREWIQHSPALARCFDFDIDTLARRHLPEREFTLQWDESDSAFLMRLWRKHGIAWAVQPGRREMVNKAAAARDDSPCHTLLLFDDPHKLRRNTAEVLRYHRDAATEERDGITLWSAAHALVPACLRRASWDYKSVRHNTREVPTVADLGEAGRTLASALKDFRIDPPRWGADLADYDRLGTLRMQHHEGVSACVRGASGAREAATGTWVEIQDGPGMQRLSQQEREYVFTRVHHWGDNNLPKALDQRLTSLFAASGWPADEHGERPRVARHDEDRRYGNSFTAVQRGTPIVPAFDPRTDWPRMPAMTAMVVGSAGQEIECDEFARIKVRILGLRPEDHAHAGGAGTNGTGGDSAWVRVASPAASRGHGTIALPRVGDEVVLEFLHGDPDKPIITGSVHHANNRPPDFSQRGKLPGNKYLSGSRSREIFGARGNQTRYDDTPGEISLQVASDHAESQVNLGYLSHPRINGVAAPRGEGAEIRSDGVVVARGGEGVYVTADPQPGGYGDVLERSPLLELTRALQQVHAALSEQSAAHLADSTEAAKLAQIADQIKDWAAGSNVDREGASVTGRPQAPMVAVSAPAGIAVASQDNLLLGAQTELDSISVGNTQISAGKRLLLRCADLLSAFAQRGMKLVAATGKILIQANQEDIELTAARNVTVSAGHQITLQAPNIRFIAQGVQVDLGGGSVVLQSTGSHVIKSSDFSHVGPGDGTPAGVDLPSTQTDHDQRVQLRDFNTTEPLPNQRYRVQFEDGRTVEGSSDAQGMTEVLKSTTAFARYTIEALDD